MRVVLALDKFKGTYEAQSVCEFVAEGIRQRNPKIETVLRPMADGGEGTAGILAQVLGMDVMKVEGNDLLGRPMDGHVYWQNSRRIALVESSEVLGLGRASPREETLLEANSTGLGKLIQRALALRPLEVWVALGGTLTADAGWGVASVFGLRAFDAEGQSLTPSIGNMDRVARFEMGEPPEYLRRTHVSALCDVNAAAYGTPVSLASFLEQKGARGNTVSEVADKIRRFIALMQTNGIKIPNLDQAYTGCAGGMLFGLSASFPHIRVELGAQRVARVSALGASVASADLLVCGEGALDEQTFFGKVPSVVASIAAQYQVPVAGIFGRVAGDEKKLRERLGLAHLFRLFENPPQSNTDLMRQSRNRFAEIGGELVARLEQG